MKLPFYLVILLSYYQIIIIHCNLNLIAPHLIYSVAPNEHVVIELEGYETIGDENLKAKIISLPNSGKIYQLSDVYNKHGYEPKYSEKNGEINEINTIIKGKKNRFVYVPPKYGREPKNGKYTEFKYQMISSNGQLSNIGNILINRNQISMKSTFDENSENWIIKDQYQNKLFPSYIPVGYGRLMNHFIQGQDNSQQVGGVLDGNYDQNLWYFVAPSKFLSNQWHLYNGYISFNMMALEGDFSDHKLHSKIKTTYLLKIECSKCDFNHGITLLFPLDNKSYFFDGKNIQHMNIPVHENSGWVKDSKSSIIKNAPPTMQEVVDVLSNISNLYILGDFTNGIEIIGIDNITYTHGDGQPIQTYKL